MFGDVARFLLNTVFTLFGAALLLRAWMQVVRMPPYNPVSNAVMQATNWIVLPLRKILPGGKIDWASILAAYIAALVYMTLMIVFAGVDPTIMLPMIFLVALADRHQVDAEPHHLDDDPDGASVVAESAVAGNATALSDHRAVPRSAAPDSAAPGGHRHVADSAVRNHAGVADGGGDAGGGVDDPFRDVSPSSRGYT